MCKFYWNFFPLTVQFDHVCFKNFKEKEHIYMRFFFLTFGGLRIKSLNLNQICFDTDLSMKHFFIRKKKLTQHLL